MNDNAKCQIEKGASMVYTCHGIYAIISSTGNTLFEGPFDECMDEYERLCGTDLDIS